MTLHFGSEVLAANTSLHICHVCRNISHHKARQLKSNDKPISQKYNAKSELTVVKSGCVWALLRQLQLAELPLSSREQIENKHMREVWSCGQNSYGELAHGDTITRTVYTKIKDLSGRHICQVSAGKANINHISKRKRAGNEHTLVLTRSGQLYSCGNNESGQCGQASANTLLLCVDRAFSQSTSFGLLDCRYMSTVANLLGNSVAQIGVYNGSEHTLVVLKDGRLMTFGYNYRGQLGHGNTIPQSVPKFVRGLQTRHVHLLSCSYYHSIVAVLEMEVFTFGRNDFGQLGHGDLVDKLTPRSVRRLEGCVATGLGCGQYHTCVVGRGGKVRR